MAYVVNSRPRSGSKRSIARSRPMLATWTRSSSGSVPRDITPSRAEAFAAGSAAVEQLVDDVDQRPPGVARLGADALERLAVTEPVALHEDALRPLDPRAAVEGAQQLRELAVALEGDVDRALQLGLVRRVDVGEHAALGGGVDEVAAGVVGERDDRADRLVDDLGDELEGVVGVLVQRDDRDVGAMLERRLADLGDRDLVGDDLVAEAAHGGRHRLEVLLALVGDEHPQVVRLLAHRPVLSPTPGRRCVTPRPGGRGP